MDLGEYLCADPADDVLLQLIELPLKVFVGPLQRNLLALQISPEGRLRLLVQGGSLALNLALQVLDLLLLLGQLLLPGLSFFLQIGHRALSLFRLGDGAVDLDDSHLDHLLAVNLQWNDQAKQK